MIILLLYLIGVVVSYFIIPRTKFAIDGKLDRLLISLGWPWVLGFSVMFRVMDVVTRGRW